MPVRSDRFGRTPDGIDIDRFVIENGGVRAEVITYGGIITALWIPDALGRPGNIVLGYDGLAAYLNDTSYFGALVGRYANRIALARFVLDGRTYRLAANDRRHHLHGGRRGFDKHVWDCQELPAGVQLSRLSPDGEEGYPGNVRACVTYALDEQGVFRIDYAAESDRPTIVNLTQHTYFNLSPTDADVSRHLLTINADRYTPVDDELIPTGEVADVTHTPFDFRTPQPIGTAVNYDHNWMLRASGDSLTPAATLHDPASGRALRVLTTEPGLQFYCGHLIRRRGLCLETQHFPDSPNRPQFPSPVLRPGEMYRSTTVWAF